MALPDITQRLKLQAEGVQEVEQSSANIHRNLLGAAQAQEALNRNAAAARKAAAATTRENVDYNQMRGIAGATGAAGRDFAEQSRGLGGLVRLYATFAANIFAVSAAFNVLREAANTTSLINGLNTLGATSGRSLGTLSKQLVEASDGAISLREAMSSVAMTSSAGMTNQMILRLAGVAKNASIALGISMPDALNRLSRGVTKLEPELLDELGIFTKIEPATQAYALELGKTASQLTDFERRQAFANAVAKEGEEKFKALADAAANPYDKLLASLKNTAQGALELLNKVLLPIVEVLSKSPTALALGLAAVVSLLIRQAIPAITQFRQGFADAADKALEEAKGKAGDALRAREQLNRLVERRVEESANKELKILEDKEAKLSALKKKGYATSIELGELLKKQAVDTSKAEIDAVEKSILAQEKAASRKNASKQRKEQAAFDRELFDAYKSHYQAEEALVNLKSRNRDGILQQLQATREYKILTAEVKDLEDKAAKRRILNNMAYNTSLVGISSAWKLMQLDIEEVGGKVKGLDGPLFKVRAAFAGIVGYLSTLGRALGSLGAAAAVLGTIYSIAEAIFSNNQKQMQAFANSLDAAEESAQNVKRTIAEIDRAQLGKTMTDTAVALSNAFDELSNTAKKLITDAELAKRATTGIFDNVVESVKSFFGYGIDDKVSKALSQQLVSALAILRRSGISKKYEDGFRELLGVESLDANTVEKALVAGGEGLRKRFADNLESARKEINRFRSDLEGFRDALDKAFKSYQEFLQSTANTNPLFKLGDSLEILGTKMITSMTRGVEGIMSAFEELERDPRKAALFGPDFISQFVDVKNGFKEQSDAIRGYTLLQDQLNDRLTTMLELQEKIREKELKKKQGGGPGGGGVVVRDDTTGRQFTAKTISEEIDSLRRTIRGAAEQQLQLPTDKIIQAQELFGRALDFSFKAGADYIKVALGQAAEKAAITIAKAQLVFLTGERAAAESTRIKLQEIDIQIRAIDVNISLIKQQEQLAAELSANTAAVNADRIMRDEKSTELERNIAKTSAEASKLFADFVKGNLSKAQVEENARKFDTESAAANVGNSAVDFAGGNNPLSASRLLRGQIIGFQNKLAQQQASKTVLQGERTAAVITGAEEQAKARLAEQTKLNALRTDLLQIDIQRKAILESIAGTTNKELANSQTQQELAINQQRFDQQTAELRRRIAENDEQFDKTKLIKFDTQKKADEKELASLQAKNDQERENIRLQGIKRALDVDLQKLQKRFEIEKSNTDLLNAKEEASLEITKAQFTSKAQLYDLDKELVANIVAQMDVEKANFDAQKQTNDAILNAKKLQEESELRLAALKQANNQSEEQYRAAVEEEAKRQQQLLNNQLIQIETERQKRLELLNIQRQQTIEQERQNYAINQSKLLAESLTGAFSAVGQKLGKIGQTLTQNSIDQEVNQKALQELTNKRLEIESKIAKFAGSEEQIGFIEQKNQLIKEEGKQTKKNRDAELKGQAQVISGVKSLFKEHTVAYKGMAALEKIIHVMRMANMLLELRQTIVNLAASTQAAMVNISNAAAEAGATGVAAIIKGMSAWPFPLNLAAGAATAAVVGALLAKVGKSLGFSGGGGGSFVPNAEQQQKVQGTAMGYDSRGKEVQVRRGVFGDTEAKSESIAKSIEKIKQTSVDGLSYDNRILKTLQSIDEGINKTAKNLYGVQGLRTGTMFETPEGTNTKSGWLGISSLFGKSTQTNIQDSGVIIRGTFDELASATNKGALAFYETVQRVVKKSGFFGIGASTKTYIDNKEQEVTDEVSSFFTDIFSNAKRLLVDIGNKTGQKTEQEITNILKTFELPDLKVSLRGLKGEELAKELESVISSILDDATLLVFNSFTKYAEFGEGLLETVIRVVDTAEKIDQQLRNLGIKGLDLAKNYDITEALAKAAGGFDEFMTQTEYFRDNFLTEAERLAPVQEGLVKDLKALGFTTVDTKEEFKALVQSIKPVDDASTQLLASLLKLAPAFNEVYQESANTIDNLLIDLANQTRDLESASTPLQKALEGITTKLSDYVEQLKNANKATAENIKIIVRWAKASALKELRSNLQTAYEDRKRELEGSINTWTNLKNNLSTFLDTLRTGSESLLSPQEKFAALYAQYKQALVDVQSTDQAVAQKATQDLPKVSQDLLNSGKALYGSSQLYAILFNDVESGLKSVDDSLANKISTDQATLDEIKLKVSPYLNSIELNTRTTNEKLQTAITAIEAFNKLDETAIATQIVNAMNSGKSATQAVSDALNPALSSSGTKAVIPITSIDQLTGNISTEKVNNGPIDNWMVGTAFDNSMFKQGGKYSDFNWENYVKTHSFDQSGIDTMIEAQRHFSLYGIAENRLGGSATRDREIADAIEQARLAAEAAKLAAEEAKKANQNFSDGLKAVGTLLAGSTQDQTDALLEGLENLGKYGGRGTSGIGTSSGLGIATMKEM